MEGGSLKESCRCCHSSTNKSGVNLQAHCQMRGSSGCHRICSTPKGRLTPYPKPDTSNSQPGTRKSEPGNQNPEFETQKSKTENRNPKRGTWSPNLEPGNWNPEPGTWNPKPGTTNPESGTRKTKPDTLNPKPETRNPDSGTRISGLKTLDLGPYPPWSRVEGNSQHNLPPMPSLRGGIFMGLDQRNLPFALGCLQGGVRDGSRPAPSTSQKNASLKPRQGTRRMFTRLHHQKR